jgi:bifunctional non-homologous end joining protein LigD
MLTQRDRITRSRGLAHSTVVQLRTPDGRMRHPSWRGLRPDRTPGRSAPAADTHRARPGDDRRGAGQTRQAGGRVEVVQLDGVRSYRLMHADNVIDGLDLTAVEDLLGHAGINLGDLVEINGTDSTPRIGAA